MLNPFHLLFFYCVVVIVCLIGMYWTTDNVQNHNSASDDLETIDEICHRLRLGDNHDIQFNKFDPTKGRICLEKWSNKSLPYRQNQLKPFHAIFQKKFLWNPSDTIRVSFLPPPEHYPGVQYLWDGTIRSDTLKYTISEESNPKWLPKKYVLQNTMDILTPEEENFEQQVRFMNPIDGIKWVVKEKLQPYVGVVFDFVEEPGDVRISLNVFQLTNSSIGTDCKNNDIEFFETMNFNHLSVQTILHEFCHVLGMVHEHQNPFGKTIEWNVDKVFEYYRNIGVGKLDVCNNVLDRYKMDSINGSTYDAKSIMLYHFPGELMKNGIGIPENIRLSELDIQWLKINYPKQKEL